MTRFVILVVLVVTVSLCVAPVNAQDHWYWLLDPGNEKIYEHEMNPNNTVHMYVDGEAYGATILRTENWLDGVLFDQYVGLYTVDAEGNGYHHGTYEPLWLFIAPYLVVDAPLEVGNTWESWVQWSNGTVHNVFTVTGEETIPVACSEEPVHCHVLQHDMYIDETHLSFTWWFNDGMGHVKYISNGMTGWGEGTYVLNLCQSVIPVEPITWGAVKSLYR